MRRPGWLGVLSPLAVCLLTTVVVWASRNAAGLSSDRDAGDRSGETFDRGSALLVLTSFLAVGREGLEISLFIWTSARSAGQAHGPALGAALGILLALAICVALYFALRAMDPRRALVVGGAALVVITTGVFAYGLGELQVANLLPGYGAHAFALNIDASSWYAMLIAGTLNLTPLMTWLQVAGYVIYLATVLTAFALGVRVREAGSAWLP